MIHPTRTNLLRLKDRRQSVGRSVNILRARRQALIHEFLQASQPFLQTRERIRDLYRQAIEELQWSLGHEGVHVIASLAAVGARDLPVELRQCNLLGIRYQEVAVREPLIRTPQDRNYDFTGTSPHVEEAIDLFERVAEAMLELARYESKIKRLGDEILHITRRTRVLEERILPEVLSQIRTISQYLGERERESYFRLKKFKDFRQDKPVVA